MYATSYLQFFLIFISIYIEFSTSCTQILGTMKTMSATPWKIRVVASQCFAALPLNILQFTCGSLTGLTTVLATQQEEITMNELETNLFVNYCYTQPLGFIFGGILAQCFGSRKIIMAADVIFICSWLLLRSTYTVNMLMCAQSLIGLIIGMIEGPSYTYLAEITQPLFRNTLMAALDLSFLVGTLYFVLMSQIMHWRDIALMNLTFPILGLSLMYFVPESPYWLANKNRYDRVCRSLSWFRGWRISDSVKAEGFLVINNAKKSPAMLRLFCRRSFYIPLIIVFFTLLVDTAGGSQILLINFKAVMEELKSPIDNSTMTHIIVSGRTVCAIVCILSIHIAGKRNLVFVSLVAGSILLIVASIFAFLIVGKQVTDEGFFWVAPITMILATFVLTAGIGNVALILNSELFPSKLRQISTGIGFAVRYIMLLIFHTIFVKTLHAFTVPGLFLTFAFLNIFGFIILYYIFPETGNRSLIEIEELYVGVKKYSDKKTIKEQII